MNPRWDNYFLDMALRTARMSKDPSTKVGAVLVRPALPGRKPSVIGTGFNGFPAGIVDHSERLYDRPTKLELVVHAEMNAVLAAAAMGVATAGTTLYVAATDSTGARWGGPPCVRCAVECIAAGVIEYVSWPGNPNLLTKWADSIRLAQKLIEEAGLEYRVAGLPEVYCTPDADAGCAAQDFRCTSCPLDR
jgi:dCMP deaminase